MSHIPSRNSFLTIGIVTEGLLYAPLGLSAFHRAQGTAIVSSYSCSDGQDAATKRSTLPSHLRHEDRAATEPWSSDLPIGGPESDEDGRTSDVVSYTPGEIKKRPIF